ncbi:MAG: RluA family pseudouridine synthase [Candidatus Omnitrophota bacterium]|nr:RluA family pseudouridine synthase [Candidatus Omnitrophota bacterium]
MPHTHIANSPKPFEIVFEDAAIIVLNKIAKILVQPSPRNEKHTLTSLLEKERGLKVWPCHRLDRETTGLIVYARSQSLQEKVMDLFRERKVQKRYLAFVKGAMRQASGVMEGYIIDKEGRRFGEKPKKAKTLYRCLARSCDISVIELTPLTGRTNQLRIQLAKIGNPILGERTYAFGRDFTLNFKRLALHAFFLRFEHPQHHRSLTFQIPIAPDMRQFLKEINITIPPGIIT